MARMRRQVAAMPAHTRGRASSCRLRASWRAVCAAVLVLVLCHAPSRDTSTGAVWGVQAAATGTEHAAGSDSGDNAGAAAGGKHATGTGSGTVSGSGAGRSTLAQFARGFTNPHVLKHLMQPGAADGSVQYPGSKLVEGASKAMKGVVTAMDLLKKWYAVAKKAAATDPGDEDESGVNTQSAERVRHTATAAALLLNPTEEPHEWARAGNAAAYWGFQRLPPLEIEVPLTVVPVGMQHVGDEVLQQWLTHLEHHLPHATVNTETLKAKQLQHVVYRYRTTVVLPGPELLQAVNLHIEANARLDRVDAAGRRVGYVEAMQMEGLLKGFLDACATPGAAPTHSYALFLMNTSPWDGKPRQQPGAADDAGSRSDSGSDGGSGASDSDNGSDSGTTGSGSGEGGATGEAGGPPFDVFGYREGLPEADLAEALRSPRVQERLYFARKQRERDSFRAAHEGVHGHRESARLGHFHMGDPDAPDVSVVDATEATKRWAADKLTPPHIAFADMDATAVVDLVLTGTLPVTIPWASGAMRDRVIRDLMHHADLQDARTAAEEDNVPGSGPAHDGVAVPGCLAEAWVGRSRIAWLDVGAGPFSWGPTVGGRGVKTELMFKPRTKPVRPGSAHDLAAKADRMQNAAPSAGSDGDEEHFVLDAATLRSEAEELAKEEAVMAGVLEDGCEGDMRTPRCRSLRAHHRAIQDYLYIVAPILLAGHNDERVETLLLEAFPQVVSSRQILFSMLLLGHDNHDTTEESARIATTAITVMPALAAAVSDFARRVVTPPSTLPDPVPPVADVEDAMDVLLSRRAHTKPDVLSRAVCDDLRNPEALRLRGVTRIAFRLLVVRLQSDYNPVGGEYLDILQLRREVEQFRFNNQQVMFSVHNVALETEPSLAMAYTTSLRTAVVPTLSNTGKFTPVTRTYVDSAAVAHQLKMFVERRRHIHDNSVLEIPIILFSTNEAEPVFVDKHRLAWPACGMVVAVQSNVLMHPTPVQCDRVNCFANLRNPVREIASATLNVLGGVLPTHMGLSADGSLTQSWLWAVGPSVLSRLSGSHVVTGFTKDVVQRNVLVQQLSASWLLVDSGIQALAEARTVEANAKVVHVGVWHTLLVLQHELQAAWASAARHIAHGDFESASDHCNELIGPARRFYVDAIVAAHIMVEAQCKHETEQSLALEAQAAAAAEAAGAETTPEPAAVPEPEPAAAEAPDTEGASGSSSAAGDVPNVPAEVPQLPPARGGQLGWGDVLDVPTLLVVVVGAALAVIANLLQHRKVVKPKLN